MILKGLDEKLNGIEREKAREREREREREGGCFREVLVTQQIHIFVHTYT